MKQSEIIMPFVKSTKNVCSTMLGCDNITQGKPSEASDSAGGNEVTGIIGLTGPDRGTIAVCFPTKTALNMVSQFIGVELTEMDGDVADGLAEIVNMISGGAKPELPHVPDQPFELGLPTVVQGQDYLIQSPGDAFWIEIPFETDVGSFSIRVSFESMRRSEK